MIAFYDKDYLLNLTPPTNPRSQSFTNKALFAGDVCVLIVQCQTTVGSQITAVSKTSGGVTDSNTWTYIAGSSVGGNGYNIQMLYSVISDPGIGKSIQITWTGNISKFEAIFLDYSGIYVGHENLCKASAEGQYFTVPIWCGDSVNTRLKPSLDGSLIIQAGIFPQAENNLQAKASANFSVTPTERYNVQSTKNSSTSTIFVQDAIVDANIDPGYTPVIWDNDDPVHGYISRQFGNIICSFDAHPGGGADPDHVKKMCRYELLRKRYRQ